MLPLGMIPKTEEMQDRRDLLYGTVFNVNRTADKVINDVREIKDQRSFGTCVSFGVGTSVDNVMRDEMSELYNYVMAKSICPFGLAEEGLMVDTGFKAWRLFGGVPEELMPYDLYKQKFVFPPIFDSLKELAEKNKIDAYVKIDTSDKERAIAELTDHLLHGSMAAGGFIVGLESFFAPERLPNGDAVLDMPAGRIAGHCMAIIGIDKKMKHTYKNGVTRTGFIKIAQSYGTGPSRREFGGDNVIVWSESGYGWIPFDYVFGKLNMTGIPGQDAQYVNEIYVPLKDIPFTMAKVDPGNINIKPYIKNNRTMLPLRFVGEMLGADVLYQEHNKGITMSKNGLLVKLNVDSTSVQVNNRFIQMDTPPEIIEGRTFVPIRAVAEAFGAEVTFFSQQRRIEIKQDNKIIEMWLDHNEARIITR